MTYYKIDRNTCAHYGCRLCKTMIWLGEYWPIVFLTTLYISVMLFLFLWNKDHLWPQVLEMFN